MKVKYKKPILLMSIALVVFLLSSCNPGFPNDIQAYVAALRFVTENKINPKGVDQYPSFPDSIKRNNIDSTYVIKSHVDTFTGLKMPIRSNFVVSIKYLQTGEWKLLAIKIKKEE